MCLMILANFNLLLSSTIDSVKIPEIINSCFLSFFHEISTKRLCSSITPNLKAGRKQK